MIDLAREVDFDKLGRMLSDGIKQNNLPIIGPQKVKDFGFTLNEDGQIFGGIYGASWFQVVFVHQLWINDGMRRQGFGSRLLHVLEDDAREAGCMRACVSTLSYEAPAFYRKQGYHEFGRVPYPQGCERIWLTKDLLGSPAGLQP